VLLGKRTRDFAFVSLCYERSGEEMCTGYAMAASGRMQYDYKQTNQPFNKDLKDWRPAEFTNCPDSKDWMVRREARITYYRCVPCSYLGPELGTGNVFVRCFNLHSCD
jgi:hypothetical protein